jgi:hypothetical protein
MPVVLRVLEMVDSTCLVLEDHYLCMLVNEPDAGKTK